MWVDLGYPARRDASGRLYKPLFAFMVIGLNGRIPLNTAGNLAAQVAGFTSRMTRRWATRRGAAPTYLRRAGPCVAPGQLDQRGRPDVRPSERVRPRRTVRTALWPRLIAPQLGG